MEQNEVLKERNSSIVKANELIRKAQYNLTIKELRLLSYIFSKVKKDDQPNQFYTIEIADYIKVCGIDKKGELYADIKTTMKRLRDKSFWLLSDDGQGEVLVGWVEMPKTYANSGTIEYMLHPTLQNYVIGLAKNFTIYPLLYTLMFKSKYSIRLYELLKSYEYLGTYTETVEQFKALMNTANYKTLKDLTKRVIDVALNEINDYTDINVTYTKKQKGRKVVALTFTIDKKSIVTKDAIESVINRKLDNIS